MKIAVALMVKDESPIILRCLESLLRLQPDLVIITDTGSKDDTIMKAGLFLHTMKIPFRIYKEPFIDFGTNRSRLLELTRKEQVDYVFMIDADDEMQYRADFTTEKFRDTLYAHVYNIKYVCGPISYHLPKFTSNKVVLNYVGVTHEFLDANGVLESSTNFLWVKQGIDSHRRVNNLKNQNDIDLLTRALGGTINENLRIRYLFYLAQTYLANQNTQSAIATYQERVKYQGWSEELFFSHYQLGQIYQEMGEFQLALKHYLDAHKACGHRAESLYNLIRLLESKGMNLLADGLKSTWSQIKRPISGLFIEEYKYESAS